MEAADILLMLRKHLSEHGFYTTVEGCGEGQWDKINIYVLGLKKIDVLYNGDASISIRAMVSCGPSQTRDHERIDLHAPDSIGKIESTIAQFIEEIVEEDAK
jgi:hypothetical protein